MNFIQHIEAKVAKYLHCNPKATQENIVQYIKLLGYNVKMKDNVITVTCGSDQIYYTDNVTSMYPNIY